jgi:predicted Zn-dependent protease
LSEEHSDSGITHYDAHAFHDSFDKGRRSGTLTLSRDGFKFLCDNEIKVHFPLSGVRLKLGGASDRLVFISHPEMSEWSIYTADRALLNHRGLNSVPEIADQLKPMRQKRVFNWSVFAAVALLIVLVPVVFLFNMDAVAAIVARQIPIEWEQQLGKSTYAQYRITHDVLELDKADDPLDQLTRVLTQQLDNSAYQFAFHIVNDPSLNAFALPGGYVVIHSGLIIKAENADELLGVLAHELSHVTQQHGLRSVITSAGVIITIQALLGDASGLMATIASATPLLLNLQYSRGFENEADEKGFELLRAANINPQGLVQFFKKIIIEQEKIKDKIDNEEAAELLASVSGFLSTHPATQERIANIEALAGDDTIAYRNLDSEFKQLQATVEAFVTGSDTGIDTDTVQEDGNENSN